jgi:hypothetical protein
MDMKPQYGIFKEGKIVFAGDQDVVERAFNVLHRSFYETAGTAKRRTDAFPYSVSQI